MLQLHYLTADFINKKNVIKIKNESTLNLIILFLIISYIVVWGYAIYDVTKTKFKSKNNKIIWTVLIFFLPVSSIIYLFYKKELI